MGPAQSEGSARQSWSYAPAPDMADGEFEDWRELLEQRTGMQLSEERKIFLRTNLAGRMRELGLSCYRDYYLLVTDRTSGGLEWIRLVDRLTVHETRFFRNPQAYEVVRDYLANYRQPFDPRFSCDAWSIGCSTGEEPYSLAMVLHDVLSGRHMQANFSVTGSDISLPVLARAREGAYSRRALEHVPEPYRAHYFEQFADDYARVTLELRRRVCFAQVNVMELRNAPVRDLQIIFCHNMLIYFRRWLRERILNELVGRLRPGGLLVIGLGEASTWSHADMSAWPATGVQAWTRREAA